MTKKSKKTAEKKDEEIDDLVEKFEAFYGRDNAKLEAWQTLCRDLGEPEGTSITQCKKSLKGVWVNIFDFIEDKEAGMPVRRRKSLQNLRNYSKRTGRIFPLGRAKKNLLLRGLLVHMNGPMK